MAKIYRLSDRIKLQVDDLVVTIGPLSIHQKSQVEAVAASQSLLKASLEAMKYAIKDIEGLEDSDGNPYILNRDENGNLSDETLEDLFNLENSPKLITISLNMINSIPEKFIDMSTGKELKGVEFIKEDKPPAKKK